MANENSNNSNSLFKGIDCVCQITSAGQSYPLADLDARNYIDRFNSAINVLQDFKDKLESGLLKDLTIDNDTESMLTTIKNAVSAAKELGSFILPTKQPDYNENELQDGSIWMEEE